MVASLQVLSCDYIPSISMIIYYVCYYIHITMNLMYIKYILVKIIFKKHIAYNKVLWLVVVN